MTYEEIQITFNDDMTLGSYIEFDVTDNISNQTSTIKEEWYYTRTRPYRVALPISDDTLPKNERSAINFVEAFNLDYNSLGAYEVTRSGITVTIKAKSPNISFSNASATSICRTYHVIYKGSTSVLRYNDCYGSRQFLTVFRDTTVISNSAPSTVSGPTLTNLPGAFVVLDVAFNITPYTGTVFEIDDVTISEADTDACNNVKINIDTSLQADKIISPINQVTSVNPIVITRPRSASPIEISVEKGTEIKSKKICVPKLLSTYIEIEKIKSPTQTTININRTAPLLSEQTSNDGTYYPLTFEYSLDGTNWQSSNSFSGLTQGNHTAYIKDNIGCQIQIDFTVEEFNANLVDLDPVCEVSNLNSIRFKKDEAFSNCGTRKTPYNTLSFEERDKRPIQNFVQWVQKCDVLKTQITSNYDTNTATLVDCDGNETALSVVKKTENMNLKDVRDGTIVIDSGRVGVRFGEGTTYNPDTLVSSGSYNLGSSVMSWVNEGDYIYLQGSGWHKITSVASPTDDIEYSVAYTSAPNNGFFSNGDVIQVSSIYNAAPYERYEFSVDFENLEGRYWVKIACTDSEHDDVSFVSETLVVKEAHAPHFLMEYYSTTNNEINYGTGIRHKLRLPYVIQLKWKPSNEQEIHVTDTNTILLDSSVREFYEMILMPLPTAMAQKVVLALSLDRLFIDGQSYIMEGEPEAAPFGTTNTYKIKATLVKSDYVFEGTSDFVSADITIEGIPIKSSSKGLLFI